MLWRVRAMNVATFVPALFNAHEHVSSHAGVRAYASSDIRTLTYAGQGFSHSLHANTGTRNTLLQCTCVCVCLWGGGGNVAEQSSVHAGRYVSRNSATVVRIFVIVVEDVPQLVSCTWPLVNVRICTSVYVMLSFTQCVCAQLDELSFA